MILVDFDMFCKIMLQPFSAGEHTIHFRGAYVDVIAPVGIRNVVTEVTHITTIASVVVTSYAIKRIS